MVLRLVGIIFVLQELTSPLHSAIRPRSFSSCGKSANLNGTNGTRDARVVGGSDCFEGEFPWMVSFKNEMGHFCGGFVVADRFVISAAHCFLTHKGKQKEDQVSAAIGEFSLLTPEKTFRDIPVPVEEIITHPRYSPNSREFDIAIIKLKKNVYIHPIVQPICLPHDKKEQMNNALEGSRSRVTTAGWGKTSFDQPFHEWEKETDLLRKVDVNLWDTEECRILYKSFNNFPSNSFICAGVKGSQSCVGDSGGPLMHLENTGKWVAIGIVSVGQQCGDKGRPSVYTDLADYVGWIRSIIQPA